MTPYYAGVTWFGTDYNMQLEQGSAVSAKFWSYVMKNIHEDLPDKKFTISDDIVRMKVDTKSGKLPTKLSYLDPRNTVKNEYFLPGTQPTELDDIHVEVQICKESSLLSTEYCPTTLVENKVLTKRLDGPYYPEENLYTDRYGKKWPILIKDAEFSVPNKVCNIHGETIEIFNYNIISADKHFNYFPTKMGLVVSPFEITMIDESSLLLPIGAKVMFDQSIILPDNSIIKPSEILNIPFYHEELEEYLLENDNNEDNNDN